MSVFREAELHYMAGGQQLGRIATVGADGTPHVVPVAWIYNAVRDTIDVGGHELERTKKFRDVARSGRAAIVIDDLRSTEPWRPRGIEIRGRAVAIVGRLRVSEQGEPVIDGGAGEVAPRPVGLDERAGIALGPQAQQRSV